MSKALMTIEAYVARDPELRTIEGSGKHVTSLSLPHTPRRHNKETNQWEDAGDTLWVSASFWEDDADLIMQHVQKGTLVRVEGEPLLREWESNGKPGVNLELKFPRFSIIPRKPRGDAGPPPTEQWAAAAPATANTGDVWNTPGTFNEETPF